MKLGQDRSGGVGQMAGAHVSLADVQAVRSGAVRCPVPSVVVSRRNPVRAWKCLDRCSRLPQVTGAGESAVGTPDKRDTHESGDRIESGVEGRDRAYTAFLLQNGDEGVIEVELAPGRCDKIEDVFVESLGFRAHPHDGRRLDPATEVGEHGCQIASPATLPKATAENGHGLANQNVDEHRICAVLLQLRHEVMRAGV